MIGALFQFANLVVEVRVQSNEVYFRNSDSNVWSNIDGIKLSYEGAIKEHPDLEGNPEWQVIAKARFREHIRSLVTEDKQMDYVIKELKKWGYKPMYLQKQGFRPKKLT